MSHRTWTTLGFGLLLAAAAPAQDLSGGFGESLFSPLTQVVDEVWAYPPPILADLNEDGLPDLAVADMHNMKVALIFGQQGVGLGSKVIVPSGVSGVVRVFPTDVDGDGHKDVVVTGVGGMTWLRGHGDGTFDTALPAGPAAVGAMVLATDADGDGRADLLVAPVGAGSLTFRKGDGAGGFAAPVILGPSQIATDPMVADLDDDGVLDIALLESGQAEVFKGLGGGAFAPPQTWSSFAWGGLDAADMDLDGTLDLVHGGYSNVATVLPGLGGLQFGTPEVVTLQPGGGDVAVADLDLDGFPDLLASNDWPYLLLTARRMGPDGPIGPPQSAPIGIKKMGHGVLAADFDGDSLPDFLAPGSSSELGLVRNALGPFIGLGHELPGPQGTPKLTLSGEPQAGHLLSLHIAKPFQPMAGMLFAGLQPANIPFAGGMFVPNADLSIGIPVTGQVNLSNLWPVGIPAGTTIYLQAWFKGAGGALSASDAWLIVSE